MERPAPFIWLALILAAAWAIFWWAQQTPGTTVNLIAGVVAGASCLTLLASIRGKTVDVCDFWPMLTFCVVSTLTILAAVFAKNRTTLAPPCQRHLSPPS